SDSCGSGSKPAEASLMSLTPPSRRSEEERAVGYWRDWLIDVEGGDAVLVVEDTENRVTLSSFHLL
ncbi:unnamed protein product, partial [Arctogadus glacialis]